MSDILTQTDERIAALEAELKKLKEFRVLYTMIVPTLGLPVSGFQAIRDQLEPTILGAARADSGSTGERKRERLNPDSSEIIAMVKRVLMEAGRPMGRREIYDAMKANGMEIRGADPVKALGTILWRHRDTDIASRPEGYWPQGVPLKM